MSIRTVVTGAFVEVIVSNQLASDDLPKLFLAFETARQSGPFVVLTDTLLMRSAPASVVMDFAERLRKMPPMKDVWLADAVVLGSSLARFALSTLLVVAPLPTEVKAFDQRRLAERWCATILRKAGVAVPEPLSLGASMHA